MIPRAVEYLNRYDYAGYAPHTLGEWIATNHRQAAKDRAFVQRLKTWLVPGRTLELGAGIGSMSVLLREAGVDIVASDYTPEFVEHMRSIGLDAHRVDALDIGAAGLGQFENLFSQSISPFITSDIDVVERAYRSSHRALTPGGRFVMIHAMAPMLQIPRVMRLHAEIALEAGFRDISTFRDQALPSIAWRAPWSGAASAIDRRLGRFVGIRFVLIASR